MSHVTLIRHGQANSAARDETSYDRLSELGHRQAAWLGAHFDGSGERFARVYCGTLRRHRETAQSMGAADHAEVIEDPRLNELSYFDLAQIFEAQHGVAVPLNREEFAVHMPRMFTAWSENRLEGAPESFDAFRARTTEALMEIAAGEGRALVVTSAGLIAMCLKVTMDLGLPAMAHACLAVMNTSVHRFQPLGEALLMTQFNAIPHLETPDRQFAQTHL
ncbi:histidine phosphatase family protein [Aquicoccus sp. SCR17]|nr:histidine phosphatase family protein [Carideicomes alvinocaridis]